jgi:uncharacterized protein
MPVTNSFILGTAQLGLQYGINNTNSKPGTKEVCEILKVASENGITILDTADAYGDASEVIGYFHSQYPFRFLVNTKFNMLGNVQQQAIESIKILNTDSINVYFYHNFNHFVNYPDVKKDLQNIKEQGIIKKIGVSIYDNSELEIALNSDDIDVIQLPFNMLDNWMQRGKYIKLAKDRNKEIQARSVFLQGLFFKPLGNYPSQLAPLKKYVQVLSEYAASMKIDVYELAMSYVHAFDEIDNMVIGIDNPDQLKRNLAVDYSTFKKDHKQLINNIRVEEKELLNPNNWK